MVGKTAIAKGQGSCKYQITKVTRVNVYLLGKENRNRLNIKGSIVIPRYRFDQLIEKVV